MNNSQLSNSAITRYFLMTLTAFLLQTSLFAQGNKELDYIVLFVGDTIYGSVQYIDEGIPREFYKKIRLKNGEGKIKKYKRKDVASFRINDINYESFRLSEASQGFSLVNVKFIIDPNNGEQYFLKAVSTGNLEHYELEWFEQGETTLWSMSLLKKQEDTFFIRADQGVIKLKREVLLDYLSNCPKIKEAINQKQVNDVGEVVDFYNNYCAD